MSAEDVFFNVLRRHTMRSLQSLVNSLRERCPSNINKHLRSIIARFGSQAQRIASEEHAAFIEDPESSGSNGLQRLWNTSYTQFLTRVATKRDLRAMRAVRIRVVPLEQFFRTFFVAVLNADALAHLHYFRFSYLDKCRFLWDVYSRLATNCALRALRDLPNHRDMESTLSAFDFRESTPPSRQAAPRSGLASLTQSIFGAGGSQSQSLGPNDSVSRMATGGAARRARRRSVMHSLMERDVHINEEEEEEVSDGGQESEDSETHVAPSAPQDALAEIENEEEELGEEAEELGEEAEELGEEEGGEDEAYVTQDEGAGEFEPASDPESEEFESQLDESDEQEDADDLFSAHRQSALTM